MTTADLPHDAYITAVTDTLAEVGLDPADTWADDCDTRGTYRYLRAGLHFTPEDTYGVDPGRWPDGLQLLWEWHPGVEEGEAEKGPVWLWAKRLPDGSNTDPVPLLVPGFANPVQVAWSLAELINTGATPRQRIGEWVCATSTAAACEAWAADETSE
ncbi:hypothetical protein [Streptomyces alboflavus]|uniref:hypothetical protein n=1 Tax=Streptomyces alboflavus TaxID=67267 RepID=UPI0004C1BB34|nr:hypothetical protein [Streptomyces alboflavus]